MEELIVYAVLCSIGYEKYDEYKEKLDQLFLQNPQDEVLLDLEGRAYKDAMLHLCYLFNEMQLDIDKFSRKLMSKLKGIYIAENNLAEFGKRCINYGSIYPRKYLKKNRFIYCLMQMTLYLGEMKSNAENCMRKQYIIMIFNSLLTYRNSDF